MIFRDQVFDVVVLVKECVFLMFVSKVKANDVCCIDSHAKWDVFEFLADEDDGHLVVAALVENLFEEIAAFPVDGLR